MPLAPSTSHPSSTNRRHYLTPSLNACCFGVVVMFDTTALCFFLCLIALTLLLSLFFVCLVPILSIPGKKKEKKKNLVDVAYTQRRVRERDTARFQR